MAMVTIIKSEPAKPAIFWVLALFLFAAFSALIGIGGAGDPGGIGWGWLAGAALFTGLGILLWRGAHESAAQQRAMQEAWLAEAQATIDRIGELEALEPLDVPINLQKNEECYWFGEAGWLEYRSVTRRVSYAGPTVSIPIMKGVRYRVGSIAPSVERTSELVPIDSGTVYVTNKRVFFDGRLKNTTIAWKALAGVQLLQGAVVLEKNTGKSPHLTIAGGAPEAAALIARAMASE